MRWYGVEEFNPHIKMGVCFVIDEDLKIDLATFKYSYELDSYAWVSEINNSTYLTVTHFCIPEPVGIKNKTKQENNDLT
jgi:hypothetical protein